ncbi:MAG: DEAD/DEAH box helicase, partial [Bacteroidales bacterium]|nr:DEAD/DEAH box helicase [Bacteroidales bacterium]
LLNKAHEGVSLVVAPTSVIFNWRHELNQFAPSLNVIALNTVADREKSVKEAAANDIILCTYGLLSNEIEHLKAKKWAMICLDEAHTIKNRDTKMSMAAMQLESPNRLILTGTPLQNNLSELWNLFQFINPGLLGSYEQFREKYIIPIESNNDFDRRNQLKQLIRSFMLRRTKSEVAEELPDKEDIKITVALSDDELAAYESLRRQAETMLKKVGKVDVNTLAIITKLRQAACSIALVEKKWDLPNSKINTLLKIIEELEDNGHKALIFSQFTSFFGIIRKVLDEKGKKYLYLDGSTPLTQRERLVKAFQTDDTLLFLISLKAGGLGLNLTAADYVIHLDPWWNPAIEQQATDRSHRIGQTNKVTVYHLIAENTIEEKILRLHKTKRDLTDAILEGTNLSHKLTIDELMELLR